MSCVQMSVSKKSAIPLGTYISFVSNISSFYMQARIQVWLYHKVHINVHKTNLQQIFFLEQPQFHSFVLPYDYCRYLHTLQCGQWKHIKHFTLINYDSRIVVKQFSSHYNSRVIIYRHKMFIRLATG